MIRSYDTAVFYTLGDKTSNPDWEALELSLVTYAGGFDPTDVLASFRAEQIGVYNLCGFEDAGFERLWDVAAAETGRERRAAIYREMQDILERSASVVFITNGTLGLVTRGGVRPFLLGDGRPDPSRFTLDANTEDAG